MRRLMILAVLMGALSVTATPAEPAPRPHNERGAAAAEGLLSPDRAAAIARQASGGRVLSVQLVRRDGRELYRIKVLTPGGVVRVLHVDARTGRLF